MLARRVTVPSPAACFLLLMGSSAVVAQDDRREVPDSVSVARIRKGLRELIEERCKVDPGQRSELAADLFDRAAEAERGDEHFAFLAESRDLHQECGDLDLALEAVAAMAAGYRIHKADEEYTVLAAATRKLLTPDRAGALIKHWTRLADEALSAWDAPSAERAIRGLKDVAKKSANPEHRNSAGSRSSAIREIKSWLDRETKARNRLIEDPEDPGSNLELGKYLCFARRDWDAGFRYLRKGSDPDLQELARRDGGNPEDPEEQLALARKWKELGRAESGLAREAIFQRAKQLLTSCLEGLKDPLKQFDAELLLKDLGSTGPLHQRRG